MIRPEEAWDRITQRLQALPAEPVPRELAAGRILAAPLTATVDVPAHDVSAMDGYALGTSPPIGTALPVVGVAAAGDAPGAELAAGAAMRIMTGAPVPRGADRVVPVESTDRGRERVEIAGEAPAGAHIRRRGEVIESGDPLLPAGHRLTPGGLALLAAHGVSEVMAHRLPTVAVLSTGDEIVPPDRAPRPGQLRDSNTDFLLAAVAVAGPRAQSLGIAGDDRDALAERVGRGLERDVLLVCGGVSMGEFDYVGDILTAAGCEPLFDRVAIQPGKPLLAARHPGGWAFGLPGNPASVMVGFWLFVRPLLDRLAGGRDRFWGNALVGTLAGDLPAAGPRDRFLPAETESAGGSLRVTPFAPRGSHDVAAFARGNALVRARAGAATAGPGDPCEALVVWPG